MESPTSGRLCEQESFFEKLWNIVRWKSNGNKEDKNVAADEFEPPAVFLLSDLPLLEAVLSVETIRLKIFAELKLKDLKNCRLVCRSWKLFITTETLLEEKLQSIYIRFFRQEIMASPLGSGWTKPLKKLNQVLDHLDNVFFPCTSLSICGLNDTLEEPQLVKFLNVHGYRFKKLNVYFSQEIGYLNTPNRCLKMLRVLQRLLIDQMPNVEYLYLDTKRARKVDPGADYESLIQQIGSEKRQLLEGKRNENLRCLKIRNQFPQVLLEYICILAPKLEETDVLGIFGSLSYYERFVVQQKNRIHLAKEFVLDASVLNCDTFEIMNQLHDF